MASHLKWNNPVIAAENRKNSPHNAPKVAIWRPKIEKKFWGGGTALSSPPSAPAVCRLWLKIKNKGYAITSRVLYRIRGGQVVDDIVYWCRASLQFSWATLHKPDHGTPNGQSTQGWQIDNDHDKAVKWTPHFHARCDRFWFIAMCIASFISAANHRLDWSLYIATTSSTTNSDHCYMFEIALCTRH